MNATFDVSVVIPLYLSEDTVEELVRSVGDVLATRHRRAELILVDDGCPQRSFEGAVGASTPAGVAVRIVRHSSNLGQAAAIQTGIVHARGAAVAVMDADLQESPDDLLTLLSVLSGLPLPAAVRAGRKGTYQGIGRTLTAQAFRRVRKLITFGAIPADAGVFCAMSRDAAQLVVDQHDPAAHLISLLHRAGVPIEAVPIERQVRSTGATSYTSSMRARVALGALTELTPAASVLRIAHQHRVATVDITESSQTKRSRTKNRIGAR